MFTHSLVRLGIMQIPHLINTLRPEASRAGFNTQFTATLCVSKHTVRFFTTEECSGTIFYVRMRKTVIFVQFVVRDVYEETGKVVIVTFYVRTGYTLLLRYFLMNYTNTFKKTLRILTPATLTHTRLYNT